jgi:hypothetical protein
MSSLFSHSLFVHFSWFTRLTRQAFHRATIVVSFWYILLICVMSCMETDVLYMNSNIWDIFIS